jgi:hypothetical protein
MVILEGEIRPRIFNLFATMSLSVTMLLGQSSAVGASRSAGGAHQARQSEEAKWPKQTDVTFKERKLRRKAVEIHDYVGERLIHPKTHLICDNIDWDADDRWGEADFEPPAEIRKKEARNALGANRDDCAIRARGIPGWTLRLVRRHEIPRMCEPGAKDVQRREDPLPGASAKRLHCQGCSSPGWCQLSSELVGGSIHMVRVRPVEILSFGAFLSG